MIKINKINYAQELLSFKTTT